MRQGAPPALEKVTALLTRRLGDRCQLLLFQHPTAGTQLPAGTVEPGEAPDEAAMRELREETGIGACLMVGLLGTLVKDLPAPLRVVTSTEHPRAELNAGPEVGAAQVCTDDPTRLTAVELIRARPGRHRRARRTVPWVSRLERGPRGSHLGPRPARASGA